MLIYSKPCARHQGYRDESHLVLPLGLTLPSEGERDLNTNHSQGMQPVLCWRINGSPEKGGIVSAWWVLGQGQGIGWVEVPLLMTFEMKEVFTGAEEILGKGRCVNLA